MNKPLIPSDNVSGAIDTATEAYRDHEDAEIDDMGNEFELSPRSDGGHLFMTNCGVTVCVHCGRVAGQ